MFDALQARMFPFLIPSLENSMLRYRLSALLLLLCFTAISAAADTDSRVVARSGKGWLEEVGGYPVLHLKGTPYEMGHQHGVLLKDLVRSNVRNILKQEEGFDLVKFFGIKVRPSHAIQTIVTIQRPFVPEKYFEEMRGLAEGAGLELKDVQVTNFLPELFHCSGFALMNSATKDGTLYHGRVLDYATGWGLQDHAVVIVYEPEGEIPFVNVTYAGFIGCVTGMNARHVSIGEMGGGGQGHWNGMPMALLVREALQTCSTLEEVLRLYRKTPRTCEYFYVVADGKTNRAVGMEASWDVMDVIEPGKAHTLLPHPVPDCALLSAGERYELLVKRVKQQHGTFTAESALRLMDRPVAMSSNLHNVLFEPKTTRFWVANAASDGTPAAEQKYHAFQLNELLHRRPTSQPSTVSSSD